MRGVVGRHSIYIKGIILAHVSIYLLSIYCVSRSKLLSMEDTTMNGTQLCLQGITVKQGHETLQIGITKVYLLRSFDCLLYSYPLSKQHSLK